MGAPRSWSVWRTVVADSFEDPVPTANGWLEVAEDLTQEQAEEWAARMEATGQRLGFQGMKVRALPAGKLPKQREGTE